MNPIEISKRISCVDKLAYLWAGLKTQSYENIERELGYLGSNIYLRFDNSGNAVYSRIKKTYHGKLASDSNYGCFNNLDFGNYSADSKDCIQK